MSYLKGYGPNRTDMTWHENGQKVYEGNYKDGKLVEGSAKYWNSKGEPVDTWQESQK